MSKNIRRALVSAVACVPFFALAVAWTNKQVGQIQATYSAADCFYFTLQGVAQADPVVSGSPWFAIARSQYGSKDSYAALLAAKMSGAALQVNTNGTMSCGYATASEVILQ